MADATKGAQAIRPEDRDAIAYGIPFIANPDLVKRFVSASLRGWQYAVEHPQDAAEIIAKWQPEDSQEFHQIAFEALVPLVDTGESQIGWIDDVRWEQAIGATSAAETAGYTMHFLEEVYNK